MNLSVIIVNYRGWTKLKLCLESLRCLHQAPFTWEVIVIDNCSADKTLPEFKYEFPEFSFEENISNLGFAHGCNRGAGRALGEYFLFLNPDTAVTLHTLQGLLEVAKKHPEFTILSCSQFTDHGKDTRPYGFSLQLRTMTSFLRAIHRIKHKTFAQSKLDSGYHVIFPDWVSGSVVMMSSKNFEKAGGWCEDFWMYYEDADLCKRVWEKGGKVALVSDLRLIHNHGGASRINRHVKALTKCEVVISRHLYIHKHFSGFKRAVMQSYFVFNNILLSQFLMAILGTLLFFKPDIHVYTTLYGRILKYYVRALSNGTWVSPRSANYKKTGEHKYQNVPIETEGAE